MVDLDKAQMKSEVLGFEGQCLNYGRQLQG